MLPVYQSDDRVLQMLQTRWTSELNPLLASPMAGVKLIKNIRLVTGTNVINHLLGKTQTGWFIVDIDGIAAIYRNKPLNDLTLTLVSNATVNVTLGVF